VFSWFFWASVNTTYRLSRYPSESLFRHLSTGSRPTRHRTRVFWASVNTTYRLSRYPSELMFPHVSIGSCPFGHVSTALRTFPPLPGRLGPLRRRTQFWPFFVDYSTRFSGVRGDFASNHPNRCFLTFPLVPACFHMLRHHSTPFDRLTAHLGRFATGPSFGPFSPLSRCFDMFPLVPARLDTFPHHSIPLRRFPADLPRFATGPSFGRFSWTIAHGFRASRATSPLPIQIDVSISSRPFPHVSTGSEPTWPASPPELSFGRPSRIIFRDLIAGHPDHSV